MTIKQRIDSDLKIALLAGEKDRVNTLRGLKSSILNAEIAANARGGEGLPEDQLILILNKEVKKRLESAEMYTMGGSPERANKELYEKQLIDTYLPVQLSDEELLKLIDSVIQDILPDGLKDMGKVIGLVKERSAGQADGGRIAQIVKEKLQ